MKYLIGALTNRDVIKQKICDEIDTSEEFLEITVQPAKNTRSLQQNRLQFTWHKEAGEQGDMTASEYRAYCKLHFGVPILRMEDDEFRAIYDEIIRPLAYEKKIALMIEPIDLPVTSRMTVKQKTQYLDKVNAFYASQGFRLTQPEDKA